MRSGSTVYWGKPVLAKSLCFGAVTLLLFAWVPANAFEVLDSFAGSDGGFPQGGVVRDKDGDLYGTTYYGGSANAGTVFRLTHKGAESVLHAFEDGADGANPVGSLTHDSRRNLFGVTANGGTGGFGTVFELANDGTETILHPFTNGTDGGAPVGDLAIRDGNLFGVTAAGGEYGAGTVFRLTIRGKETVLHSFSGGSDGYEPLAGVIADRAGALYGTTYSGGAENLGTIYTIGAHGTETVLHAFAGGNDGASPAGPLVFDTAGNLFGTTVLGGTSDAGTVYKLAPDGIETVLYSFTGGSEGADPDCGLAFDSTGNLYGTTPVSEADGDGAVFKLAPGGAITVLHAFSGRDGANPQAGLIADGSGHLFGTAPNGGAHGYGVVFVLKE